VPTPIMTSRRVLLSFVVAVAAVGVAAGCGGNEVSSTSVPLGQQGGSGQSGTATFTSQGSTTRVVIELSNPPAVPQPSHIHRGTCESPTRNRPSRSPTSRAAPRKARSTLPSRSFRATRTTTSTSTSPRPRSGPSLPAGTSQTADAARTRVAAVGTEVVGTDRCRERAHARRIPKHQPQPPTTGR